MHARSKTFSARAKSWKKCINYMYFYELLSSKQSLSKVGVTGWNIKVKILICTRHLTNSLVNIELVNSKNNLNVSGSRKSLLKYNHSWSWCWCFRDDRVICTRDISRMTEYPSWEAFFLDPKQCFRNVNKFIRKPYKTPND